MAYQLYQIKDETGKRYRLEFRWEMESAELTLLRGKNCFPVVAASETNGIDDSLEKRVRMVVDNVPEHRIPALIRFLLTEQIKSGEFVAPNEGVYLTYLDKGTLKSVKITNLKKG